MLSQHRKSAGAHPTRAPQSQLQTPNQKSNLERNLIGIESLTIFLGETGEKKVEEANLEPTVLDNAIYVKSTLKVAIRSSHTGTTKTASNAKPKNQPETQPENAESLNFFLRGWAPKKHKIPEAKPKPNQQRKQTKLDMGGFPFWFLTVTFITIRFIC